MKRMHLKRRKNRKNRVLNIIIIILILLSISIFYILRLFNQKALPQLIEYSKMETSKIVSSIINSTVTSEISNNIDMENLFITTKDSEGNIKSIDFNSSEVNNLLVKASKAIEQNLRYLESGNTDKLKLTNNVLQDYDKDKLKRGIIYELPSGIIFDNILLNNILPKIPIKMNLIGNVYSKLTTDIESYGINNALIKVNIEVQAEVKILMPFISSKGNIESTIPIIMKLIEGDIPSYYFDGYLNNKTFTNEVVN